MSFRLEVRFYGLCHLVQNSDRGPVRACLVLPKADHHDAKIELISGTLHDSKGQSVSTPIPLIGKRVDFELAGRGAASAFTYQASDGKLLAMVDLKDLLSDGKDDFTGDDPQIVSPDPNNPRADLVQAQVLLRSGTLGPDATSDPIQWRLPHNLFDAGVKDVTVADKSLLSFPADLDSVRIHVSNFDGTQEEVYELSPAAGLGSLEISNECNLASANQVVDRDFNIHYELLLPAKRLATEAKFKAMGLKPVDGKFNVPLPERLTPPEKIQKKLNGILEKLDSLSSPDASGTHGLHDEVGFRSLSSDSSRIRSQLSSGGTGKTGCNCLQCNGGTATFSF